MHNAATTSALETLYAQKDFHAVQQHCIAHLRTLLTVTPVAPARHFRDLLMDAGYQTLTIENASASLDMADELRFADVDGEDMWFANLTNEITRGNFSHSGWPEDGEVADLYCNGARIGLVRTERKQVVSSLTDLEYRTIAYHVRLFLQDKQECEVKFAVNSADELAPRALWTAQDAAKTKALLFIQEQCNARYVAPVDPSTEI